MSLMKPKGKRSILATGEIEQALPRSWYLGIQEIWPSLFGVRYTVPVEMQRDDRSS